MGCISAQSLRSNLSFLASDALEGRPTPSPGLTIAAEYIAAQFRRAGLEEVGGGFFQTCRTKALRPKPDGFRFSISYSGKTVEALPTRFDMRDTRAYRLRDAPLIKVPLQRSAFKHLRELSGKVVITEFAHNLSDKSDGTAAPVSTEEFVSRLVGFGPALLVVVDRDGTISPGYFARDHLPGPEPFAESERRRGWIGVTVNDPAIISVYDTMPTGITGATLSMNLAAPVPVEVNLRNVVGILRGSDPDLQDSYVVVSAHYDGTGSGPLGWGDRIWNAANDDGSGTVSVIEIASALATLRQKPRRSVIFAAFFGEEEGSLGARCYVENPVVPLIRTVADINLEQLGRTDSPRGNQRNKATVTGMDYSSVGQILQSAGEISGITVNGVGTEPDPFFQRSDNLPFAERGIPAHTVCVALEYPDYHGAGDEWEKIDYENMERTNRTIALAILTLAQSPEAPSWNPANSHARPYLQAWQKLHSHQIGRVIRH